MTKKKQKKNFSLYSRLSRSQEFVKFHVLLEMTMQYMSPLRKSYRFRRSKRLVEQMRNQIPDAILIAYLTIRVRRSSGVAILLMKTLLF